MIKYGNICEKLKMVGHLGPRGFPTFFFLLENSVRSGHAMGIPTF